MTIYVLDIMPWFSVLQEMVLRETDHGRYDNLIESATNTEQKLT